MATALTHAVMALPFAPRDSDGKVCKTALAIGALLAVAPDVDVLWWRLLPGGHMLNHRGLTHSLLVAVVVGTLAAALARRLVRAPLDPRLSLYLVACMVSHGLLDTFTRSALGVALLAPFDDTRYLAPVRFISAAWIAPLRALSHDHIAILGQELLWIWAPAVAIFVARGALTRHRRLSSLVPGGSVYNRLAVAPVAGAASDQDPGRGR
ncbi:MAG: metal-dependent hydrolase [Deltaproteobacteria bacterium]|nr:metal-dependent hydrolase [Deltaproteobacteria bacterium]